MHVQAEVFAAVVYAVEPGSISVGHKTTCQTHTLPNIVASVLATIIAIVNKQSFL